MRALDKLENFRQKILGNCNGKINSSFLSSIFNGQDVIFINTYQQLFKMMRPEVDLATFYDVIVPLAWSYWLAFSAFAWDLRWDECFFKQFDKLVEILWN